VCNYSIITIDKGASSEILKDKFVLTKNGITSWLRAKNIIDDSEDIKRYQDIQPWTQLGEETYYASFIISTSKQAKQLIIKALISLNPEKTLKDWNRRRKILNENGIPVSNWYFSGNAIIIEDYYPKEAYNFVNFEKLLNIGYKLDNLGFRTLSFISDIRADKFGNPFYVDFGFDLGEQSDIPQEYALKFMLNNYPSKKDQIYNYYIRMKKE
jgi:hypothetical protein